MQKLILGIVFGLAACHLALASTCDLDPSYKQLKKQLLSGQYGCYLEMRDRAQSMPNGHYLEYLYLKRTLSAQSPDTLHAYIERYRWSALADRLASRWLSYLAIRDQWLAVDTLLKHYKMQDQMPCLARLADRDAIDWREQDKEKLLTDRRPYCKILKKHLIAHKKIPISIMREYYQSLILQRNFATANSIKAYFSGEDLKYADILWRVSHNPHLIRKLQVPDTEPYREILIYGLDRIARPRHHDAIMIFKQLQKRYHFSDAQIIRYQQRVAREYAYARSRLAMQWYAKIPVDKRDALDNYWYMRSCLYFKHWRCIQKVYPQLPQKAQMKAQWRYWHAKALYQLGNKKRGNQLMRALAKTRNYYAVLAKHHLNLPLRFDKPNIQTEQTLLKKLLQQKNIVAAQHLFQAGDYTAARLEWRKALKNLDEHERYHAAKIAHEWGWHERAIRTLFKSPFQHDLELRFPLAHRDHVEKLATKLKLSPALIYAIIRQESAFMHDAKSSAGAMGLMQLMPQTAHRVSRRANISHTQQALLDQYHNLLLGSTHIAHLQKRYKNNMILSIAAYNAGSRNVNRWLRKNSANPTRWIENIPWRETRRYVKSVIAFYVIYQQLLDKPVKYQDIFRSIRR